MGLTQAALADRQRQRLGMAAAVLAALATMVALATGDATARTESRSSRDLSGGYRHATAETQPCTGAFEQRRA